MYFYIIVQAVFNNNKKHTNFVVSISSTRVRFCNANTIFCLKINIMSEFDYCYQLLFVTRIERAV